MVNSEDMGLCNCKVKILTLTLQGVALHYLSLPFISGCQTKQGIERWKDQGGGKIKVVWLVPQC